jgi:hypothetical protein
MGMPLIRLLYPSHRQMIALISMAGLMSLAVKGLKR